MRRNKVHLRLPEQRNYKQENNSAKSILGRILSTRRSRQGTTQHVQQPRVRRASGQSKHQTHRRSTSQEEDKKGKYGANNEELQLGRTNFQVCKFKSIVNYLGIKGYKGFADSSPDELKLMALSLASHIYKVKSRKSEKLYK